MYDYWRTQALDTPLFPDIMWSRPERRDQAGHLGIIGGNKLGFRAIAESYEIAQQTGAGSVRVLLPDCLKKQLPNIPDAIFAPTGPSGSLSSEATPHLAALGEWADEILLIGDAGRNSETAVLYEQFITSYKGRLVITRDTIDLVKNAANLLVDRPDTMIVASFAQVQKMFQNVYYPKMLTFSMQLAQVVEALHKFTITYPVTVATLHRDQLIIASKGEVITQQFSEAMQIWRGETATKAAAWWLWSPQKPLEAFAASLLK